MFVYTCIELLCTCIYIYIHIYTSPYPVANKDFSSDSLEQHATNFNILA